MGRSGVWPEDARLELLDGVIYNMTPVGPSHVYRVLALQERFTVALGGKAVVLSQSPVRLSDRSEPEPDLALLKPPKESYRKRLAGPEDILLIIEVADSSLDYDRNQKLPLYARAGIAELWIVNLQEETLERYRHPELEHYRDVVTLEQGREVAPLAFPHLTINWWH